MERKKKGFIAEFKEFAMKGNVVEIAIGMIIGTAFTAIVSSFVEDIITPLLSIILGHISFADLSWEYRVQLWGSIQKLRSY